MLFTILFIFLVQLGIGWIQTMFFSKNRFFIAFLCDNFSKILLFGRNFFPRGESALGGITPYPLLSMYDPNHAQVCGAWRVIWHLNSSYQALVKHMHAWPIYPKTRPYIYLCPKLVKNRNAKLCNFSTKKISIQNYYSSDEFQYFFDTLLLLVKKYIENNLILWS